MSRAGLVTTIERYSLSEARSDSGINKAVKPVIIAVPGMVIAHCIIVIAAEDITAGSVSSLNVKTTT